MAVDDAVTMMLNVDPDAEDARMAYLPQETTIRWTTQNACYIRGLGGCATEGHYALADGNHGFSGSFQTLRL